MYQGCPWFILFYFPDGQTALPKGSLWIMTRYMREVWKASALYRFRKADMGMSVKGHRRGKGGLEDGWMMAKKLLSLPVFVCVRKEHLWGTRASLCQHGPKVKMNAVTTVSRPCLLFKCIAPPQHTPEKMLQTLYQHSTCMRLDYPPKKIKVACLNK